jgi:hypothetical protein
MHIIDAPLIVAMLFFLFLPITDRKTAWMKLCVLCALAGLFTVLVMGTHAPKVEIASIVRQRGGPVSSVEPSRGAF